MTEQADPQRDSERIELLGGLSGEVMVFQAMRIRQISKGGMQIETGFPLQLDSLHDFRLTLPGGRSVVVKGRVAHARISDVDHDVVRYLSGVEFVEPSEHVVGVIAEVLEVLRQAYGAQRQ
jgi:hypothetical protein